jgi:hypothetical protein
VNGKRKLESLRRQWHSQGASILENQKYMGEGQEPRHQHATRPNDLVSSIKNGEVQCRQGCNQGCLWKNGVYSPDPKGKERYQPGCSAHVNVKLVSPRQCQVSIKKIGVEGFIPMLQNQRLEDIAQIVK